MTGRNLQIDVLHDDALTIGDGHVNDSQHFTGAVTGAVGIAAALSPLGWAGLFSADPAVLATTTTYLTVVGPAYAGFGAGLALYFASQGAGRVLWPVVVGAGRLALAVGGGWLLGSVLGLGLAGIFLAVAVSFVAFALGLVVVVRRGAWGPTEA